MKIFKRYFLILLFWTNAFAGNAQLQDIKKPNIIFILTDDYANNLVDFMPNLKAMQKEGVTFSDYYVSNSLCCPSRSSIFTGMLPHNTHVETNTKPNGGYEAYMDYGDAQESFCVSLQNAGYKTAMMGKFLNGYLPRKHQPLSGWSDWFVSGAGYRNFDYDINSNGKVLHFGNTPQDYLTDVLSARADSLIRAWKEHPFFIEIATFTPHGPFIPAPRHEKLFNEAKAPRTPAFNKQADSTAPGWLRKLQPLGTKQIDRIDNIFRNRLRCVLSIDEMLGNIRKLLNETGISRNTYIFFSSDNGYHLGDYSMLQGKQTPFDIDIRVPLIVCGPNVAKGSLQKAIVSNIDLAPTFSALAATQLIGESDGKDIQNLLHEQNTEKINWRNFAIIEHRRVDYDRNDPDRQEAEDGVLPSYTALRFHNLLYVEYETGEVSCYDAQNDPYELKNIVSTLPIEIQKKLHSILLAAKNCGGKNGCWGLQMMNFENE
ncbi:MAG: sulfatase [Bacteroidetes bacterium]|nr:MAG: sulfatase [Bacteroidota bacterium]